MKHNLYIMMLLLAGVAFGQSLRAQTVRLVVKDTANVRNAMFINHGEYIEIAFDADGTWTYNGSSDKTQEANIFFMSTGKFVPLLLEPGKSSVITVGGRKGDFTVKYSGDNALENRFLYEYSLFMPEKYERNFEDVDEEWREAAEQQKFEDITFEEAFRRLDARYAKVTKAAKAVKDAQRRAEYTHKTELRYLVNRLDLNMLRTKQQNLDPKTDGECQRLIAMIDPNDAAGLDVILGLPQKFMASRLTRTRNDRDQTAYAVEYMDIVRSHITDATVRHALLSELAGYVFNASFEDKVFEMDKFWDAFTAVADKATVGEFQPIIDSRRATASGKQCPDVTFSSPDGTAHRLSEYFGTWLYIDIWATWCGPCCAEIPYIEKLQEHYKDEPRLKFLSISIDSNHDAWKRKLEKDCPQWLQFVCSREENATLCKQWAVTGIPRFIIIAPDGTINNSSAFKPSDPKFTEYIDALLAK